jgi:hypothetical protein
MSKHQEGHYRELAERIARRIKEEESGDKGQSAFDKKIIAELNSLRVSFQDLQRRLSYIESHINQSSINNSVEENKIVQPKMVAITRSPWTRDVGTVPHPSQQRFGINEAVSELVDCFEQEKICEIEPGGKPCDHCGMCSSRGY